MKHIVEINIDDKMVKEFFKTLPLRKKMALVSAILADNMPVEKQPLINWTPEDKERAKKMYEVAMKTPREIAKLLNRPENSVTAFLKDECHFILPGILGKKLRRYDNPAILADLNNGMTVRQVAAKYKCSTQHVYSITYKDKKTNSN